MSEEIEIKEEGLKGGNPKRAPASRRSQSMFVAKGGGNRTFAQELKAGSMKILKKKTHIGKANKKYWKLVNKMIDAQSKGYFSVVVKGSLIDEDMWEGLDREGVKKKAYRPRTVIDKLLDEIRKCVGLDTFIKLSWKHA